MTTRQTLLSLIALVAVAAAVAPPAQAQDGNFNRKTVLTFSQPFEIPGMVLPAGTYTFQLADTLVDRHIVSISSADGSKQIAMAMGIATNRVESTNQTVVTFSEVPVGAPDAIRTWFYPGRNGGVEFVYPKQRALELAALSKVIVPAIAVDAAQPDLKTVPLVAITPELREVPVTAVVSNAVPNDAPRLEQTLASSASPRELPRTASTQSLAVAGGLMLLLSAAALVFIGKPLPSRAA